MLCLTVLNLWSLKSMKRVIILLTNSWYYRSLFVLVLGVGVGGLLRAQRRPRQCCHSRGICMLPFQKKYGVCLYKCPTIVMINRCGNETGKVCIFNVNKSLFVIFTLLDTDNDVRRIAYAYLVYQYTYV